MPLARVHVQPKDLLAPTLWPVYCTAVSESASFGDDARVSQGLAYFRLYEAYLKTNVDGIVRERDQP
jgi:hypothetical protein